MYRSGIEDEGEDVLSTGCHGDDLMTPPDALLQMALKEAEQASNNEVILSQSDTIDSRSIYAW